MRKAFLVVKKENYSIHTLRKKHQYIVVRQCKKTAHPQMAHLVFADTRANAQKTKRAIFCQRSDKRTDNKK